MDKSQWIERKILTREALVHHINAMKVKGKKIVFTNGCFDILHRGHLDYLAKAADMGNLLIVGINTDKSVKKLKGADRPLNNENDRAFQIASMLCVEAVCLFDEDTPASLIEAIKPDVLVKGGDYSVENIAGADFVKNNGGLVSVIPFLEGYSTTGLIDSIKKL